MAERPDLEHWVPILRREVAGAEVEAIRLKKPVVLRMAVEGAPEAVLAGRRIADVRRRGHFVLLPLDGGLEVAIAPMLAGRFDVAPAGARATRDLALAFVLRDGRELRFRDDAQMGKVYVIRAGAWAQVPGLAEVGVDVLDPAAFTRERFREIARRRRDQAKVFLLDKAALDSFGNAFADEALFEAGIHPKTFVRSLSEGDLHRLHDAIVRTIADARATILARAPPLPEKLRDFLKVRNRAGEPCLRCGTKIRKAGVHGHDAFFCPRCQPEARRSSIVDWRELPPSPPKA